MKQQDMLQATIDLDKARPAVTDDRGRTRTR